MRESFESRSHELAVIEPNILGVLSRNTTRAARVFNLPSDRTVEVGIQVDL